MTAAREPPRPSDGALAGAADEPIRLLPASAGSDAVGPTPQGDGAGDGEAVPPLAKRRRVEDAAAAGGGAVAVPLLASLSACRPQAMLDAESGGGARVWAAQAQEAATADQLRAELASALKQLRTSSFAQAAAAEQLRVDLASAQRRGELLE